MKVGIILALVIVSIFTTSQIYAADSSLEFGTRFLPSKIVEDQEATIQVYAKQGTNVVPEKISGLTVTSLDSSILRATSVKDSESGFVAEVTVMASKAGTTTLFLAAPGFSSLELPVIVYGNKLNQEKLLVKAVPDSFSSAGPLRGLVSVELADEDGFPVIATEDVNVSLSESNSNVLGIYQKNLVIKKGEYFVGTHFTVKDPGEATIYASAQDMEGKSNEIKVDDADDDLTIKLYTIPEKINISGERTIGRIIAQLQDESEEPVVAKKDILVTYKVTNSVFDDSNISENADIGESAGTFIIKKGTYWGHTTFDVLGGSETSVGTYDITITAGDPIALDTEQVEAEFDEDKDQDSDKFIKFETVPIFATGNKELIGVVYLEDEDEYPLIADKDLEIIVDSSDNDFLSVDPVTIEVAEGSALVFGNVGHSIPDELELNAAVETDETDPTLIDAKIFGPDEDLLILEGEPLINKILTDTEFPIVIYLEESGEVVKFPKRSNVFVSPSDIFDVQIKQVFPGDQLLMLDTKSTGKGSDILEFTVDNLETLVTIESLSIKPADIHIEHSETIFAGTNDVFSIQLLNSEGLPVFANEDIEIKLVVQDESLMQIPKSVTIKEGDYFSLFDVALKSSGITELSALTEDLPLVSSTIEISSLSPIVEMTVPDLIENGEVFIASIAVKQDNLPLSGLGVQWDVDGGILQLSDSRTGTTGEAVASIISTSNQKVDVRASVSGSWYTPNQISKTVRVNATSDFVAFAEDGQISQEYEKFEIGGFDPLLFIVPAAIVIVGYMLKKQGAFNIPNPKAAKPA